MKKWVSQFAIWFCFHFQAKENFQLISLLHSVPRFSTNQQSEYTCICRSNPPTTFEREREEHPFPIHTRCSCRSINRRFNSQTRAGNGIPSHKSYEREIENQMHTPTQHTVAVVHGNGWRRDGLIDDEYEYRLNFQSHRRMRSVKTEIEIENVDNRKKQTRENEEWKWVSRTSGCYQQQQQRA